MASIWTIILLCLFTVAQFSCDIGVQLVCVLNFFGQVIIPEKSSVTLSQPKVEIKLLKADVAGWSSLDLKQEKREETSQDDSS